MHEDEKQTYAKIIIGLTLFAAISLAAVAIMQDPQGAVQALTTTHCDASRCY